ncbi:hypothetical protein K438DRAFT_1760881 [Mycena galopus ATCC 62051]|nr:hypothetical protein K438DRAFT_1760881 [Mycena galopus ATCC 62051]
MLAARERQKFFEGNQYGNKCERSDEASETEDRLALTSSAAQHFELMYSTNALVHQPWCASEALQAAVRGGEAGTDGHGTVAPSALRPSDRPSIRLPVDGTPVLTTVRRRDGGLSRPTSQRRDGTIVRPSVCPTVLDGYGDDPYLSQWRTNNMAPFDHVILNI